MPPPAPAELAWLTDVLAFHLEAGADAALDETPVDRFAESARPEPARPQSSSTQSSSTQSSSTQSSAPSPLRPAPSERPTPRPATPPPAAAAPAPAPPEAAAMAAREAAASAQSLGALRALLETFDGCPLKFTASRLVFSDGNPLARLMFVGEAPGREEDIEGLPFVGRSGKLLDRMMAAIGLDRSQAYIANVVPWRPPGNRTPTPQETAICLPFVRRQIELANPDVLVCLGGPSAQTLLGIREGITKARGRWVRYETGQRGIAAIATFHPAYLLRTPLGKRLAWRDFLAIERALKDGGGAA